MLIYGNKVENIFKIMLVKPWKRLSDKYRGILSKKQSESLNKHIAEMRSEWKSLS
jgi:hypothetical protein